MFFQRGSHLSRVVVFYFFPGIFKVSKNDIVLLLLIVQNRPLILVLSQRVDHCSKVVEPPNSDNFYPVCNSAVVPRWICLGKVPISTRTDKRVVRYGLVILQATNLALWSDMLVRESKQGSWDAVIEKNLLESPIPCCNVWIEIRPYMVS